MSDTATATAVPGPLSIMHIVNLPGLLGGREMRTTAALHTDDQGLFDSIVERYGTPVIEGGENDTCAHRYLRTTVVCDGQEVDIFYSDIYAETTVDAMVRANAVPS